MPPADLLAFRVDLSSDPNDCHLHYKNLTCEMDDLASLRAQLIEYVDPLSQID